MTVIVIAVLAWLALSLPVSLAVGRLLRGRSEQPELEPTPAAPARTPRVNHHRVVLH